MQITRFMPALVIGIVTLAPPVVADEIDWRAALDFEAPGAWRTAPDLLDEFGEDQLWSTRTTPFAELAGGVELSPEHVTSGARSAKWSDHPRYPTIHCRHVPTDWSAYAALAFQAFSEEATGERITLGVASDSEGTPYHDWLIADFVVDWTGWRTIEVPLADFEPMGDPAGWDAVDGVYFFTKIFDRQPNPYTVLHLDAMALLDGSAGRSAAAPESARETAIPVVSRVPAFAPSIVNHHWPELREPGAAVTPIQYLPYFRTERALFGYYPRFGPGFVSFSPGGRGWLRYAGDVLETMGEDGRWTWRSILEDVLVPYARDELGFAQLEVSGVGTTDDASIRWDADGDAYMLCFVSDPTGDWRTRTGLLLHSRNDLQSWEVYRLPWYMARFEKFVGHNPDRLKRPPVILLSRYFGPNEVFVTVPRKQPDGTLVIPEPTMIADDAICIIPHSGEANSAVTVGDTVYIAYGRLTVLPGHTKEDGVPAYVVSYGVSTGELSEPVRVGCGGKNAEDGHNWPAIAVDSGGYLHVIVNGHADPFVYTRSARPLDITEWTEPEKVAVATSYGNLICDSEDTLYCVTRNSDPGYYFRLALHRKRAGQPWEEPRHLTLPFKPYYEVYYHKLVMDPVTERLFLSYYSQSGSICLFRDEFRAYAYTWPDREIEFLSVEDAVLPTGSYASEERKYQFYAPGPSELTILVSDDRGDTWRLATSDDFARPPGAD